MSRQSDVLEYIQGCILVQEFTKEIAEENKNKFTGVTGLVGIGYKNGKIYCFTVLINIILTSTDEVSSEWSEQFIKQQTQFLTNRIKSQMSIDSRFRMSVTSNNISFSILPSKTLEENTEIQN